MEDENAKSQTEEGKNEEKTPEAVAKAAEAKVTEAAKSKAVAEPEAVVKPTEVKGASKPEPEDYEHKYNTLLGQQKKLQKDYDELRGQQADVTGLSQKVEDMSGTLNLVVDILQEGASYSEEMQERVKKTKEAQEAVQKREKEEKETIGKMSEIAQIADLQPRDEALKPAWDALNKGDHSEALRLTTIAVKTRVSSVQPTKPTDEKKPVDKEALKQLNVTPAVETDWRDKSAIDKIKGGVAKHREEQD